MYFRKRLRKSSTGSGSGSTERTSEELPSSEVTLTSSSGSIMGTVIKTDPGFASECSTPSRSKQHSSDSELHRGSSHESMEGEAPHHITLVGNLLVCESIDGEFTVGVFLFCF